MKAEYMRDGYYLVERAINTDVVISLIEALSEFDGKINNYGVRDLMRYVPEIHQIAISAPILTIAREILGDNARPVRSVFFDKVPEFNWNVAWHQDTSIAVKRRYEVEGFGPWSEKQGVIHTEPPVEYLANILTLRIHLDVANQETGVLRVVPGTHRNGRVKSQDLLNKVSDANVVECIAAPGDVLLMSPLLFHSSRKAVVPSHRRVIHIEYSAMKLPEPLEWYETA
ncbi:MAG: phytanoyl-CoA dioxygenase family protein [Chromatiales bacterium]|nr:phytanoyl-CoA dioxygenase family protein [Chromatiales bacterium]